MADEKKQDNSSKTLWINGNVLNGGEQAKPEVQKLLAMLGLEITHAIPKANHSSGKDLIQISGSEEVINGLACLIKGNVAK